MKNEINEKENKKAGKSYVQFMGLATQMMVVILSFTFLGYWLDKKFETEKNYLTAAASLFGVFTSLYLLFKQLPKE